MRAGRQLMERRCSYVPAMTKLVSHDLWCTCAFLSPEERSGLVLDLTAGQFEAVQERVHWFGKRYVLAGLRGRRTA